MLHAQNWVQNFVQNDMTIEMDVLIGVIYVNTGGSFQSKLKLNHFVKDFIPNFVHEAFS